MAAAEQSMLIAVAFGKMSAFKCGYGNN